MSSVELPSETVIVHGEEEGVGEVVVRVRRETVGEYGWADNVVTEGDELWRDEFENLELGERLAL